MGKQMMTFLAVTAVGLIVSAIVGYVLFQIMKDDFYD
jgi:hypothetical protein